MFQAGTSRPVATDLCSRPWRTGKAGFSLLELLLVLVIVGLGTLFVLPAVEQQLRREEVRRAAVELAAAARALRSRAISEGMPQYLTLSAADNSYRLLEREVRLSPKMRISHIRGGEPVGNGLQEFIFYPNGSTLGGEIAIVSRDGLPRYTVRLEPLSGRVLVVTG